MAIEGREQLKNKFNARNIGYESYRAFIESSVNIKDDGIEKNDEDGLKLSVRGASAKLLSFYDDRTINYAEWFIRLNPGNNKGLDISHRQLEGQSFFLSVVDEVYERKRQKRIRVGIGTNKPQFTLDVDGTVSMKARVGAFKMGKIAADGRWYTILDESDGLESCQAYEIFAHINDNDTRRYALTHAMLLISDGPRGETIKATSRYLWGKFLNRIKFRRKLEAGKWVIQIKSRDHFGFRRGGGNKNIYYRVTKLWDKDFENENYQETKRVVGKRDPNATKRIKIKR